MTQAQDRYDAAAQRHSDALQRAITRAASFVSVEADKAQLTADLATARAEYDALLDKTTAYLEAAADALDAAQSAEQAAAVTPVNPAAPQQ